MKSLDEFYGVQNPYMDKLRAQQGQINALMVHNRKWRERWDYLKAIGYDVTCEHVETKLPLFPTEPADAAAGGWIT